MKNLAVFLSCYPLYSIIFFIVAYIVSYFCAFLLEMPFGNRPKIPDILPYFTILFFLLVLIIGLMLRKKYLKDKIIFNLYLTILLFCFPTINSYLLFNYFQTTMETGFGGIYPFGYGVISFFIKKVDTATEGEGYGNYIKNRFNPDIFTQIFHDQWLLLHFLSLVLAVVCVFLYGRYLKKSLKS